MARQIPTPSTVSINVAPAIENGQAGPVTSAEQAYVCSNVKCGHAGPARQMVNLPLEGRSRKALLEEGLIFCRDCSRQGVEMGLVFYELHKTLAFLQRQVDARQAVTNARRLEAGAMFQAVKAAQVAKTVGDDDPQAESRARRQDRRDQRDSRSQEWEDRRNGAANGYAVQHG